MAFELEESNVGRRLLLKSTVMSKSNGVDESLSTMFDDDQRMNITLLVAKTMVAMRDTLISSFDAHVIKPQKLFLTVVLKQLRVVHP